MSKTEAVEAALRGYLRTDAAARLRAIAGAVELEDVASRLRHTDRST